MRGALNSRERLLVLLPSWLGDFVACEPVARALVERFGERVTLVAPRRYFPLLGPEATRARCVALEDGEPGPEWRGHDVALLLTGSFRSALAAWRARIPRRIGFARDGRSLLLTAAVTPAREVGATPLELGVAGRFPRWLPRPVGASARELIGLLGVAVRDTRPRIEPPAEVVERVRARLAALGLAPGRPFVLANVGARPQSAKGFPAELFAATLAAIGARHAFELVLVCGPGEEAVVADVERRLAPRASFAPVHPPPDLLEFAALARLAELVVTTDSGPRHVANAVGAKLVVVAGPTDPRHTAEHLERTVLVRTLVPCGPCHRELCPLEGATRHRCMTEIEPARLAAAAAALLA
ncbi:MAG: glycosyltransferase family 9 protein [Planctomycetes bacterium]|nr:glycosyltransferase family 9 protein [Planctomycetota bacterium]